MDENKEEDFAMLIRKVGKMFYNKKSNSNFRRSRQQENFERKREEMGDCFHCKKTSHPIADCPSLQATTSKKVHKKKKAMVATWDISETESEEEVDTANVYFMENGDEVSKVNFETSLDEDDLTMDKIAKFFEE